MPIMVAGSGFLDITDHTDIDTALLSLPPKTHSMIPSAFPSFECFPS
jgi:hypothetical protein